MTEQTKQENVSEETANYLNATVTNILDSMSKGREELFGVVSHVNKEMVLDAVATDKQELMDYIYHCDKMELSLVSLFFSKNITIYKAVGGYLKSRVYFKNKSKESDRSNIGCWEFKIVPSFLYNALELPDDYVIAKEVECAKTNYNFRKNVEDDIYKCYCENRKIKDAELREQVFGEVSKYLLGIRYATVFKTAEELLEEYTLFDNYMKLLDVLPLSQNAKANVVDNHLKGLHALEIENFRKQIGDYESDNASQLQFEEPEDKLPSEKATQYEHVEIYVNGHRVPQNFIQKKAS